MTMPEILRRKLMERIDIASEPDDGEVLEEIDRLILGEEETRYLPVAQKAELRRQLFYSVRRLDVLQELLEDAVGVVEVILILVVLIGLVLIFKKQLVSLVNSLMEKVTNQSNTV